MAIDFPVSSASPWTNPETGVTYTWNDTKKLWEANVASTPADDVYVEVTGDTMTGPLVVQDNITLTGKVTSAATQAGDIATICTTKGYVDDAISASEGAETGRLDGRYVQVTGDNMTGNLTIATDKVKLNTNGSAEFDGNIKVGDYNPNAPNASDLGVYSFASGSLWINSNAVSSPIFVAKKDNNDSIYLYSDGSAEFAGGDFEIFPDGASIVKGAINVVRSVGTNAVITGSTTTDTNTSVIRADGSAEFAGSKVDIAANGVVTTDVYMDVCNQSALVGIRYGIWSQARDPGTDIKSGSIILQNYNAAGRNLTGLNAAGTAITSSINSDGSAEFAGNVDVGDFVNSNSGFIAYAAGGIGIKNANNSSGKATVFTVDANDKSDVIKMYLDGSAQFAGMVSTDVGIYAETDGLGSGHEVFRLIADNNRQFAVTNDGTLKIGGAVASNPNVLLNPDGSAEFAGRVKSDVRSSSSGSIAFYGLNDTADTGAAVFYGTCINNSGAVFRGTNNFGATSTIYADGSAEFAGGEVKIYSDGGVEALFLTAIGDGTDGCLNVYDKNDIGTPTARINANGSAEFAGTINVGNGYATVGQSGSTLFTEGTINVRRNNSNGNVFAGYPLNGTLPTSLINADGSAEFADTVTTKSSTTHFYCEDGNTNSTVYAVRNDGEVNIGVGTSSSNPKIALKADGSATFDGDIDAGNVSFKLEPDNDANYTTTTDAEGNESRVYNGPTLDVKDRLTKTQDALTALKTAAEDNATDLAGLKAAIVAALANI